MCYCAYRLGGPFAVHVSRDVSNNQLRASLVDRMQDMFKDSAFSQVIVNRNLLTTIIIVSFSEWCMMQTLRTNS